MGIHKGDSFENIINLANIAYERKGIALVQKIPTPMKPKRKGKRIVGAYYEEKSTLDYVGVFKHSPLAFDAKETSETTRFPLFNIKIHQTEFMSKWSKHGGITFLLVNFKKLGKTFRLDWTTLSWYWKQYQANRGKKGFGSIPINEFECNCKEIRSRNGIVLDYLEDME